MRRVTLHRALVAITALTAVAWSAGMAAALAHDDTPTSPAAVVAAPVLVEAPECWAPAPVGELPQVDGAMVQTVTVTILPTAILRLDATGQVAAAETNTGCAPRATDQIYVEGDDGTLVLTPGFDVATVRWTGDFTTFGFLPQQPQG